MHNDPLDDLLGAYSKQSTPPPFDRLTSGVWREIELRRGQTFWTRTFHALGWQDLFSEPRLAVPALAAALLIGLLPALSARSIDQAQLARQSLHFEVFSSNLSTTSLWSGPPVARKSP